MYKTLKEMYGSEVKFTQHLSTDVDSLNKITKLVGLPKVIRAENEYSIPNGSIDVVGFTARGEAIVFEHQDQGGRADQNHINKTVGYAHQMMIKGFKVLGSILMCESVDEHYIKQFANERKEYTRRKYNGHKNLHIVKSQWTEQGVYTPELFDTKDIIRVEESWPLDQFRDFVNIYAREWRILGEEKRPGTTTLWFRDISRGRHYIHLTKKAIKVGVHFDLPTKEEKDLVTDLSGRHSQKRSTVELVLDYTSGPQVWWSHAEWIKQQIRSKV
jgi:hypothetical protein